jgi:hypothetical protein
MQIFNFVYPGVPHGSDLRTGRKRSNKMTRKRGRPSSTEDGLNGKLHLIHVHHGKVTKECAVCSNREVNGGRRETLFYCDMCPRKQDSTPISNGVPFGM